MSESTKYLMRFYEWYHLTESLMDKYSPYIDEFISKYAGLVMLHDPRSANCGEVSAKLIRFLEGKGIHAELICALGWKGEFGDDPHPDYFVCPVNQRCGFYHYAVKTEDGTIIDLT